MFCCAFTRMVILSSVVDRHRFDVDPDSDLFQVLDRLENLDNIFDLAVPVLYIVCFFVSVIGVIISIIRTVFSHFWKMFSQALFLVIMNIGNGSGSTPRILAIWQTIWSSASYRFGLISSRSMLWVAHTEGHLLGSMPDTWPHTYLNSWCTVFRALVRCTWGGGRGWGWSLFSLVADRSAASGNCCRVTFKNRPPPVSIQL